MIAGIAIIRNDHVILKGTLIPLGLALVLLMGYGGFLALSRNGHLEQVKSTYAENPEKAIQQEYAKAHKDNKAYSRFKPIWVVLIIVTAVLYLFFKSHYFKGLSLGLMGLFLIVLLIDSLLQYRLKPYYEALTELVQ